MLIISAFYGKQTVYFSATVMGEGQPRTLLLLSGVDRIVQTEVKGLNSTYGG
jgi:hypothetical protein